LFSGPSTYTLPPVTVIVPFESSPSPPALIWRFPPEIFTPASESVPIPPCEVPSLAFIPSSLAVTDVSPPLILINAASIPS